MRKRNANPPHVCHASGMTLHPLHPLTPDEIRRTAEIARTADGAADAVFVMIGVREPAKDDYLAWTDAGGPLPTRRGLLVAEVAPLPPPAPVWVTWRL